MDFLKEYGDDAPAVDAAAPAPAPFLLPTTVSSAPGVSNAAPSSTELARYAAAGSSALIISGAGAGGAPTPLALALRTGVMTTNIPADALWAVASGPANPYAPKRIPTEKGRTLVASLEADAIDCSSFEAQYRNYTNRGIVSCGRAPRGGRGRADPGPLPPFL